jgi:hypothetical protein
MKSFFDFLSYFDWISPTATLLEDIFEGGFFSMDIWTFFIPFNEAKNLGWYPFQIRELLAGYGIKSWGDLIDGDELSFNVKLEQAQWAEYVLLRYGVPVNQKSLGAPRSSKKSNHSSNQKKKSSKHPLDFLDKFLGE